MRTPETHLEAVADFLAAYGFHLSDQPDAKYQVTIPLTEAVGRVSAGDVRAAVPSPLFDNSQMDGYAISADQLKVLPAKFPVGKTVPAGTDPNQLYPNGITAEVIPVMTGARLPQNTAAVIPVEDCEPPTFEAAELEGVLLPPTTIGKFVRLTGSDIAVGDTLLPRNTLLTPVNVAALIGQRLTKIQVWRRTRVVICTGGAEIGGDGPASIPDVNGPMLVDLCRQHDIEVVASLHTNDEVDELRTDFEYVINQYQPDAIITSGGISHGKFEVIRLLLDGPNSWFDHVAQQPGGPQGLAVFNKTPVICLPGNPISTLVSFRLFIAPLLGGHATLRAKPDFGGITAYLTHDAQGLPDERDQFRRGRYTIDDQGVGHATILGGSSSHLLAQAARANCLIRIPAKTQLSGGDQVKIYRLWPRERP
ncbi:MAG: molybdopterin molybdenumtransferase MoeA [Actinomycetales bacterium]|nr:MAG: molybdopterin molybdenumtransferase MoeA [Actinomycetales bacterium]